MDADLDTLATALYARIDDTLKARPDLAPWRPKVGIAPKLSDAELLTLAVMQALLGFVFLLQEVVLLYMRSGGTQASGDLSTFSRRALEGDNGSCLERFHERFRHAAATHSKRLVPGKTINWPIVRLL